MVDELRSLCGWLRPTILLCSVGFFTHFKPSGAYLTPYLKGPHKNLTDQELVNQIYPVWSYSYTAFLIPIFLLTDYLRYKPIVILQGLGNIGCWVLLVFASGVPMMQLMQVSYGLASACSIGYYSYIYSVIEAEHYQKATSYVRTSKQLGLFLSSSISQILVSFAHIDYLYLNVMSLVNIIIGFIISLFLPLPTRSLYFYGKPEFSKTKVESTVPQNRENNPMISEEVASELDDTSLNGIPHNLPDKSKWKSVLCNLLTDLKQCYSNAQLLRWSIWWALSTCGWNLVVNYIQNVWEIISPSQGHEAQVYNGAVEAAAQILSTIAAFSVGYLKVDWGKWGEMFLGFGSIISSGLILVMCITNEILLCYVAYVIFMGLYNFVMTIAQFRIAIGLTKERFALIFGMNTFIAVVLNSLVTIIIVDDAVLGLNANTQFVIYSIYFAVIAIAYLSHGVYDLCSRQQSFTEEIAVIDMDDDREEQL